MSAAAPAATDRAGQLVLPQAWVEAALLVAGLAAVVAARWAATLAGLDALLVGVAFGAALATLAIVPKGRLPGRPTARTVAAGIAVGVGIVLVAAVPLSLAGTPHVPGLARPPVAFAPWALATILVATAEEALIRGTLFDRLRRAGGVATALALTTAIFALMHVPLYGWQVVPLDLAVGLALGGLRIVSGGIAAPAIAHALPDLATWWL